MKIIFKALIIGILLITTVLISSCTKTPKPCFFMDKGPVAKSTDTVNFDASCSKNAASYYWDFSDGTMQPGNPIKHKFAPGQFKITLTVYNGSKFHSTSQELTVNP